MHILRLSVVKKETQLHFLTMPTERLLIRDARNRFFTAKPLDLRNMTGGRQRGCWKGSEGGLTGKAMFLQVSLLTKELRSRVSLV